VKFYQPDHAKAQKETVQYASAHKTNFFMHITEAWKPKHSFYLMKWLYEKSAQARTKHTNSNWLIWTNSGTKTCTMNLFHSIEHQSNLCVLKTTHLMYNTHNTSYASPVYTSASQLHGCRGIKICRSKNGIDEHLWVQCELFVVETNTSNTKAVSLDQNRIYSNFNNHSKGLNETAPVHMHTRTHAYTHTYTIISAKRIVLRSPNVFNDWKQF